MKAEIKGYDCIDHDPIEKWKPENTKDISIVIAFHIGPKYEKGSELFYANIVTQNNIPPGQNAKYIKIEEYDFGKILEIIDILIGGIEHNNWEDIGKKINKYMDWEFDNYQKTV